MTSNLQPRDRRTTLIVDLTRQVLAAPDVPTAVQPILDTLVAYTAAEGSAYFQESNQQVFFARASSGVLPSGPAMDGILTHGLPGETPLMMALRKADTPLFFDNTAMAAETVGFPELGVASLAATPVRDVRGSLLGAFLMHTFESHQWTPQEASWFAGIASVLAHLAARLVAEEKALAAQEDALRALGLALEHRDGETKGHTDRVTELVLGVAAVLGLDESDTQALRWGAYLHDIGKIGIADAILRKPARLNEQEWEIMRGHSRAGYEFAAQLGFLPPSVLDLILHHHERWAGGGYPADLRGDAIPLLARIFAICDVYDALTSERPYKRAWSHEEAIDEIERVSGQHFDPAIVDAFIHASATSSAGKE
jgi:putative nucleotidyltransferase with HDIG domain